MLAFVSDEEAGGARARITSSITTLTYSPTAPRPSARSAGYSISLERPRLYAIQTAEKGINWLRLTANATPGHGSMVHDDNAVTMLAAAVSRIGEHELPVVITDTVRATSRLADSPGFHRPGQARRGCRCLAAPRA